MLAKRCASSRMRWSKRNAPESAWQAEWQRTTRPINFFELLCQSDDGKLVQAEALEFAAGRGKLALAAIDDDQVGEPNSDKFVIPNRGSAERDLANVARGRFNRRHLELLASSLSALRRFG